MNCQGKEVLEVLADELPHVGFFYFVLATLQTCYGERDFRVSLEKLIERYSPRGLYTVKHLRYVLKRLVTLGLITADARSRRFTLVRVLRLKGTEKGTEKGTVISLKKQPVLQSEGTGKGTGKGNGVGVDVSPGVDVLSSALTNRLTADGSDPSGSSPDRAGPDPQEREWVKDVLFKDCPLYQSDKGLNAVDPDTGAIVAVELYRSAKAAYTAVDIFAEIKKAHTWEIANKARRKKDRSKYLNNWFSREQDRGGIFKNGPVTVDKRTPRERPQTLTDTEREPLPSEIYAPPKLTPEEIAENDRAREEAMAAFWKLCGRPAKDRIKETPPVDEELPV